MPEFTATRVGQIPVPMSWYEKRAQAARLKEKPPIDKRDLQFMMREARKMRGY